MVAEFRWRNIPDVTQTLSLNTQRTIPIPRDANVQVVTLCCQGTTTISSGTPAITKRQLWSLLNKIEIIANGNIYMASVDGGSYFDFFKYITKSEPLVYNITDNVYWGAADKTVTTATAKEYYFEIPFIFSVDHSDLRDTSGVIPANALSSFDLSYSTGSAHRPAITNLTAFNGTCWVKVREARGTFEDLREANKFAKFFDIYYNRQNNALSPSSNMGASIDLLTQKIHQKIGVATYKVASADWTNKVIDRLRMVLTTPLGDKELLYDTFYSSVLTDSFEAIQEAQPGLGCTVIDCENDTLGLPVRGAKAGDLKLYYNTGTSFASGDTVDITYKSLLPRE